MKVQQLIERYGLNPHPEGGWYREVYRSPQMLLSPAAQKERSALTHIYFLLVEGQVSRFHRVLHDEVWNFYSGAPLKLLQYDGKKMKETILGEAAGKFAAVVAGGTFQAAETIGVYSLAGCSVAPGFNFEDFSFLADDPYLKQALLEDYPQCGRLL